MTPLLVHPYKKKQFMIISLLYSLHSLVSPVSLQKWIFVNSDQKLWKADIKASADIQFCLVFCLYFLLFYRYSRIVDVFFIVGLRARGQPDLDTIFFIRFPEALWFCNRMWPANTSYSYTTNAMVQFGGFHHFRHHNLIWLTM